MRKGEFMRFAQIIPMVILAGCSSDPREGDNSLPQDNFSGNRIPINFTTYKSIPLVVTEMLTNASLHTNINYQIPEKCLRSGISTTTRNGRSVVLEGTDAIIEDGEWIITNREVVGSPFPATNQWNWQACPIAFSQRVLTSSRVAEFQESYDFVSAFRTDATLVKNEPICVQTNAITVPESLSCKSRLSGVNANDVFVLPDDTETYHLFISSSRAPLLDSVTFSLGKQWDPNRAYEIDLSLVYKVMIPKVFVVKNKAMNIPAPRDESALHIFNNALMAEISAGGQGDINSLLDFGMPSYEAGNLIFHCGNNPIVNPISIRSSVKSAMKTDLASFTLQSANIAEEVRFETSLKNIKFGDVCSGGEVLVTIKSNDSVGYFEPISVEIEREML